MPLHSRGHADRDRRRIEAGEPAWGHVIPGTDEVKYFTARRETETLLFRMVANEGAFYTERYAGCGRWVGDSKVMTFLISVGDEPMEAQPVSPRQATREMAKIDGAGDRAREPRQHP